MRIGTETKKEAIMKHSARVMSLLIALSGAVVPAALAQTAPAQTPPPATHTQESSHPKASGAAKGAAMGAMMGGNAAKGAVIALTKNVAAELRTKQQPHYSIQHELRFIALFLVAAVRAGHNKGLVTTAPKASK